MKVTRLTRGLCCAAAATAFILALATIATAETITVTDIASRTVDVEKNHSKVIIGTGVNRAEANPAKTAVLFGYGRSDPLRCGGEPLATGRTDRCIFGWDKNKAELSNRTQWFDNLPRKALFLLD